VARVVEAAAAVVAIGPNGGGPMEGLMEGLLAGLIRWRQEAGA
jgi:hypothetical protein